MLARKVTALEGTVGSELSFCWDLSLVCLGLDWLYAISHSTWIPIAGSIGGYVPDGMTPEQWNKMQAKERAETAKKNFAAFGPQTFKSRSLQSFQKELEKGKAAHLMPVFNAKEKLKAGTLRKEDIPYMQRGKGIIHE